MRLKSLELFGFKSFANRTRFDFGPGVTIIVGPNGCGKSNVVDSLKWVLGEQSAKSLRGSEMLDVVFNGSQTRKPLGFAEVSLTFRDCRGTLHPELDEIRVTRKLHRSGESEYMINRETCRLKDIRELFMDTGVGMKAYSIIEQGRIDALLHASNLERRSIFDEAAGISKYKARKKEAKRRLDRAEQNLVVLDATLEEVTKNLRSLKIQAGRARKFLEYKEELRKLRIAQSLHKYHTLLQDQIRVSGDLVVAENAREGIATDLGKVEAELSEMQHNLIEQESRHREMSEERTRLDQLIESNQHRRTGLEHHLKDLETQEIRLQGQRQDCLVKIEKAKQDVAAARERWEAVAAEKTALEEKIDAAESEREAIRDTLGELLEKMGKFREQGFETESLQARKRNDLAKVENDLGTIGRERAGFEATRDQLVGRRDLAQANIQRLARETEEVVEQLGGLRTELQSVQSREKDLEGQLERVEGSLSDLSHRKIKAASRVDVLKKYHDRLEGVTEGVARVVRAAKGETPVVQGVQGLLADRFRVDPRHVKAVEAVLNLSGDVLVVSDLEAGLNVLRFLKDGDKGRGRIVPVPAGESPASPAPDSYRENGVIGRAADLVQAPEQDRGLAEFLLGRVLVVENLERARALADLQGGSWTYATLDGDVLEPGGVLTGGVALRGRMSHSAEMEELGEEVLSIERKMRALESEKTALTGTLGGVKEQAKNLSRQIFDLEHEKLALSKQSTEQEEERAGILRELSVIEGEIASLSERHAETAAERDEIDRALADMGRRLAEIREAMAAVETERDDAENRRMAAEKACSDLRIEHSRVEEREGNLRDEVNRIETEIGGLEEQYRDAVTSIEENANTREDLRNQLARLEEDLIQNTARLKEVRLEVDHLGNVCDGLRQETSAREGESRELRTRLEEVTERINNLKVKENGFRVRVEEMVERSADDLKVVLPDLYEDFDDESADWEAMAAQIEQLKDKIDRLGHPNVEAIALCDEEEARFEYLNGQKQDLVQAKEQLLAVIRKIDRRSKELFIKVFHDIRENFKVLFRKLFGGGKADIVLEDESELLECGIDIIAQPRDKKPSSITLLSGGEKVMTCIALTFAIFMAKPSPFCILDEVDAALDEGNIDRFVGMLQDFVKGSQFIIISHNKKTMMVGDAIFGVTMQESGVSKKVSLKMEEADELIDDDESGDAPKRKDWKDVQDDFVKRPGESEDEPGQDEPAASNVPTLEGDGVDEPEDGDDGAEPETAGETADGQVSPETAPATASDLDSGAPVDEPAPAEEEPEEVLAGPLLDS